MKQIAQSSWLSICWAFFCGLWLVGTKLGLSVLDPGNIDWLPKAGGDLAAHFLGWHYFKMSPWTVPFGTIALYAWPQVTNVGYTDSIPLLAVPLRILFSWVDSPFQYFGLWYLLCYVLGVYFAWSLLRRLGVISLLSLLAGSFLIGISPFLLFRWGHDALCAHWLILAVFLCYLNVEKKGHSTAIHLFLLTLAATWIHPYMTLMIFVLSLSVWVRFAQKFELRMSVRAGIIWGILGVIYVSWALIGYFQISTKDIRTHGYGDFSANLNTFFNPLEHSFFLPELPMANDYQYEGYSYLGLGVIMLLIAGILFQRKNILPSFRAYRGMWIAVIALALFAISHQWTFGDFYLFKPKVSDPFTDIFRSGGRFIWPAAYAIMLAAILAITRIKGRELFKNILLIGALAIQVVDMYPFWQRDVRITNHYITYPIAPQWDSLLTHAEKLLIYPPWERTVVHYDDFITLSLLAAPYQIPISTGYLSRYDNNVRWPFVKDLEEIIATGDFCKHPQSVLICGKNQTAAIQQLVQNNKIKLWFLDGYFVVVPADFSFSAEKPEPIGGRMAGADMGEGLHDFLERNKAHTMLLAVSDEASEKLCPAAKEWFSKAGCTIDQLHHRDSWLAIIHQGLVVKEAYSHEDPLQWTIEKGESIGSWTAPAALRMASGGMNNQLEPRLDIDDTNHADRNRGIQIAVLDDKGSVLETACFDTYLDCYTRQR